MQLEDWLDDLCVRFIINLPPEELESVERICFQVEEAQWFYEDFIRPLDPHLPSLSLRAFSLRIFQHCPLFSQWSAQHHTTAFAEFLAYKQRVPVRGAIMLNDAMDEVVLVKGWKKGANWSFPRGKINKDEDDLDCAVREVYEETGYDIQAAGLVPEPKDRKYIEVTMREQHMRLYVFRGVPKNTYFEPRTRKEISKIEWYKLTDLPTLKRHKYQDSNGENLAVNANKFYMVAPFLSPLKKWIAQQKKQDHRRSSQPAYLAPPPVAEETVTEDETEDQRSVQRPDLPKTLSHGPSDLPEVSLSRAQDASVDPSSQLKRLLNINASQAERASVSPMQKVASKVDPAKSSALLALLRGDSTAELRAVPSTPLEQSSFSPDVLRSPHRTHPRPPPFSSMEPPPPFPFSPEEKQYQRQAPTGQRSLFQHQPRFDPFNPTAQLTHPGSPQGLAQASQPFTRPNLPVAPYQRTGDPEFSHGPSGESRESFAPPASALPKLTNHTRALLDVFKTGPAAPQRLSEESKAASINSPQGNISIPESRQTQQWPDQATQTPWSAVSATPTSVDVLEDRAGPSTVVHRPKTGQQASLLDLFRQSSVSTVPSSRASQPVPPKPPVELAANASTLPGKMASNNDLLSLLKKENEARTTQAKKRPSARTAGEGETSATINRPLNQPYFGGIVKTRRHADNGPARSPVASDRTLFDPKQPTPVKILARPDDSKRSPARSPRVPKAAVAASPKRILMPKEQQKEPPKPFQPQILRRPQTAESQTTVTPAMSTKTQPTIAAPAPPQPSLSVDQQPVKPSISRQSSNADTHRQTLLSLFNKPAAVAAAGENPTTPRAFQFSPDVVSPLTASQIVSAVEERSVQKEEPISTRSRMGSVASIASSNVRPTIEKRHTAAGDKAFLLGYLGRIANREG